MTTCIGICCLLVLALIFILVWVSMAVVPPTEFGLTFNRLTQAVGSEPLENGRYLIGPFSYVIPWPAVAMTVEFSNRTGAQGRPINARTSDSLPVTVQVSFQLKLKKEGLRQFYLDWREDGWKPYVQREAANQILLATAPYKVYDFWARRSDIARSYRLFLQNRFNAFMDITDVQLHQVELPAPYEERIVGTQTQKQAQLTKFEEQQAAVVRAEIQVMMANFTKWQRIIENTATAKANLMTKSAEAEAQSSRIMVENTAIDVIKENLVDITSGGIVAYQKGIAYQTLQDAKLLFGIQQTAALVRSQSGLSAGGSAECGSGADRHRALGDDYRRARLAAQVPRRGDRMAAQLAAAHMALNAF